MGMIDEIRRRARYVAGPLLGIVMLGYFAYHTVHGDRGVIALLHTKDRVADSERHLAQLTKEKALWERRVKQLHPESLDPDMLDERVRLMLGYARADDVIVLLPANHQQKEKP